MKIERKQVSKTELLLFFPLALPIIGTFYRSKNNLSAINLLENIYSSGLADTLLLTKDFMYLKTTIAENLADLEILSMAELDDFVSSGPKEQFAPTKDTQKKIQILLKTVIAPFLQKDGGNVEFLAYGNGQVKVRFLGKCQGCLYAKHTLKERVEKTLICYLPEIREAILA